MSSKSEYENYRRRIIVRLYSRIATIMDVFEIRSFQEWSKAKKTSAFFHNVPAIDFLRVVKDPCRSCLVSVSCIRFDSFAVIYKDYNPTEGEELYGSLKVIICEKLARRADYLYRSIDK